MVSSGVLSIPSCSPARGPSTTGRRVREASTVLPGCWMGDDVAVRSDELDRLDRQIRGASRGPALAYADVLERAIGVCDEDPDAAAYLDVLELHSELAETYDRLGRVEEALRHADVLVEHGYRCEPDPRCRRAEILTRHGRLAEAAPIWEAVAADTPDDVWVYNNAGLEYGAIGEHELALSWLTRALELTVRTGDPERLVGQLRELRAASLTALGREPDALQSAVPTPAVPGRWAVAEQPEVRRAGRPGVRGARVSRPGRFRSRWRGFRRPSTPPGRSGGRIWPTARCAMTRSANRSPTRCTAGGWRVGCGLTGSPGWLA